MTPFHHVHYRILGLLNAGPRDSAELSTRLAVPRDSIEGYLRELRDAGRIRRRDATRWEPNDRAAAMRRGLV